MRVLAPYNLYPTPLNGFDLATGRIGGGGLSAMPYNTAANQMYPQIPRR